MFVTCFQAVIRPRGLLDQVDVVEGLLLVDLQLALLDWIVGRQVDGAALHHKGQTILQCLQQHKQAHKHTSTGR